MEIVIVVIGWVFFALAVFILGWDFGSSHTKKQMQETVDRQHEIAKEAAEEMRKMWQ